MGHTPCWGNSRSAYALQWTQLTTVFCKYSHNSAKGSWHTTLSPFSVTEHSYYGHRHGKLVRYGFKRLLNWKDNILFLFSLELWRGNKKKTKHTNTTSLPSPLPPHPNPTKPTKPKPNPHTQTSPPQTLQASQALFLPQHAFSLSQVHSESLISRKIRGFSSPQLWKRDCFYSSHENKKHPCISTARSCI